MADVFQNFIKDQIREIERYKWIESEKAGCDLGDEAVADWVSKYALIFRTKWEKENGIFC